MATTIFKTQEGQIIMKSKCGAHYASRAIKKAASMGVNTLYCEEESGRLSNYSFMLSRYYEDNNQRSAA